MSETKSELRHVKPGVWIRQFKQEAAKLGIKERDMDIAGAHWLKERGKSPKQAADMLHGKQKGKGGGGIPMFHTRLVPADRRAIAAVLRQQGRDDLAAYFVAAKPSQLYVTKAQPSRLDKVMQKHKANLLADLRLLIGRSGAAPGAQKQALSDATKELNDTFRRVTEQLGKTAGMS